MRTYLCAVVALLLAIAQLSAVSKEAFPAKPLAPKASASPEAGRSAREMFEIGASYFPRDLSEARRWLQAPANLGYAWAQYYLGKVECAAERYTECAHWLLAAGTQGFTDAGIDLFNLYEAGRGLPKDKKSACMWALASGHFDPEDIDACRTALSALDFMSVQAEASQLRSKRGQFKDFDD